MSVAVTAEAASRRRVGRPSKAAPFRDLMVSTLVAQPETQTHVLLGLAKAAGYNGEKSALYALVADLRGVLGVKGPRELALEAQERRQAERRAEGALRAARREERRAWDAKNGERIAERVRERLEAKSIADREREDRRTNWTRLQYRPTAADEESTKLRVLARKWLASRDATHKANSYVRGQWRRHLEPFFGDLEPHEVDTPRIRAFVEDRLAHGLSASTIGVLVQSTFSSLFAELIDQGIADRNPVRSVPKAVRRLYRSKHDPRSTPFLERMEDIARLRGSLREPLRTFFSVGVMSGIRPGEIIALEWGDFRSDLRSMHVQRRYLDGKIDTPKSGKPRIVPLQSALGDVLREWRKTSGPTGLVFKPTGRSSHLTLLSMRPLWIEGIKRAGLPYITFYQATRHTFASQWVMAGHSIEKLSKILGHSSITITEVYAHLKPESLTCPDLISFGMQTADISTGEGMAA